MSQPLTEAEVTAVVNDWYLKLDLHAPMIELLPLVIENGLYMKYPEAALTNLQELEGWYQWAIRRYFDEVHEMRELNVTVSPDGTQADVKLCVYWAASMWNPPDRYSQRVMMNAYQTWVVKRSPATGKAVIVSYIVDKLEPQPGSAAL